MTLNASFSTVRVVPPTPEQLQKLREMAGDATPSAPPPQAPPAPAQPPQATDRVTTTDDPVAGVPAGDSTVTPPTPPASRWKRKVKAFDEEYDVDLESMSDADLDKLIGKGLAHDKSKDRYISQRDEAREDAVRKEREARAATNVWWTARLSKLGYQYKYDPNTDDLKLEKVEAQTASQPSIPEVDLDLLEKAAVEENTAEAWAKYNRAIRTSVGRPLTAQDVERVVQQRLEAQERTRSATESEKRAVDEANKLVTEAFSARQADFNATGTEAETWRKIARDRAIARDVEVTNARAAGRKITDADAHKYVIAAIHETAELAKRSGQPARAAAAPSPRAPTVIPAGGAPASSALDPAKIDRSTPEGKAKAIQLLRQQAEQRSNGRHPVGV